MNIELLFGVAWFLDVWVSGGGRVATSLDPAKYWCVKSETKGEPTIQFYVTVKYSYPGTIASRTLFGCNHSFFIDCFFYNGYKSATCQQEHTVDACDNRVQSNAIFDSKEVLILFERGDEEDKEQFYAYNYFTIYA